MAFVNIENAPVSIQLSGNESITVPAGEVWNVGILASNRYDYSTAQGLKVNGIPVFILYSTRSSDVRATQPSNSVKTILAGGDVIATESANITAHIGGFVVKQS